MKKRILFSIILLVFNIMFVGCGKTKIETNVKLSKEEITICVGETETITLEKDGIIIIDGIKWESNNKNIAIINNGEIKGIKEGKTNVSAEYDGSKFICDVTVVGKPSLSKEEIKIEVGSEVSLNLQAGATSLKDVEWSTDDKNIATVENGLVKGVNVGSTLVRAKYKNKTYVCRIEVLEPFILDAEFYCKITVAEMENQEFEFKINFTSDKKYVYTRIQNDKFEEWKNEGKYERIDGKIVLTSNEGIIKLEMINENTLKSVGKMMTGGMEEQLTFTKVQKIIGDLK